MLESVRFVTLSALQTRQCMPGRQEQHPDSSKGAETCRVQACLHAVAEALPHDGRGLIRAQRVWPEDPDSGGSSGRLNLPHRQPVQVPPFVGMEFALCILRVDHVWVCEL